MILYNIEMNTYINLDYEWDLEQLFIGTKYIF